MKTYKLFITSIIVFLSIIFGWIVFYIIIVWAIPDIQLDIKPNITLEHMGQLGDSFNVLTSLFTGLAFAGVIVTVLLQKKELEETREEFKRQAEALELQQVDNKFFQMLDQLNNLINRLEYIQIKGINVFDKLVTSSESYFYDIKEFQTKFNKFNYDFDSTYKYYFLNLYQIINYIDQNIKYKDDDPKEKKDRITKLAKEYINIIRAQQTRSQLKLLFFNCIGISSFSTTRYKELVEKYAFFEHVRYSDLLINYDEKEDKEHNTYEELEARYIFYKEDYYKNNNRLIDSLLVQYEENAFGTNEYLKEIWNNRSKLLGDKNEL